MREFLHLIWWAAETAARPTFRNLTESYEGWAYRQGILRPIAHLERNGLLEGRSAGGTARIHRLTDAGRLAALGGRDPIERWKRSWDGRWRLIVFDVPQKQASLRARLRRTLTAQGFGCLQNSVWISPDRFDPDRDTLALGPANVETLILLEARPGAGETDQEIVAGAWNFPKISQHYLEHDRVLADQPPTTVRNEIAARNLVRWVQEEHRAWMNVVAIDPFLPARLLPAGYPGRKAWEKRTQALKSAGRQLRDFRG